jgi:hypothetical protein
MQRRTFGTAVRFLVAGGTLVSWLALFAGCGSDTQTVNVAVLLTSSTVAAVQAVPLSFPNGLVFSPDITGAVTLTFTSTDTFTLVGAAGSAATGVVTYGRPPSCTFDVQVPGGLIPAAALLTIPTCLLRVNANNVEAGGNTATGTVTLALSGAAGTETSNAVTAPVSLNGNSELFVRNPVTGASVDMGISL